MLDIENMTIPRDFQEFLRTPGAAAGEILSLCSVLSGGGGASRRLGKLATGYANCAGSLAEQALMRT